MYYNKKNLQVCGYECSDSCLGEIKPFNSKTLTEHLFGLFLDLKPRFLLHKLAHQLAGLC